ncbi:MAG: hypothetical protein UY22_C0014G0026 [Candidatus Amesbacteria bacterium GW2011_GWC1_48_10]|nr:MAG: hypothetical protein UY22_C0014G0026 [Candidatus Amesbacteria bacterium GW2011_GWC1_48_10]
MAKQSKFDNLIESMAGLSVEEAAERMGFKTSSLIIQIYERGIGAVRLDEGKIVVDPEVWAVIREGGDHRVKLTGLAESVSGQIRRRGPSGRGGRISVSPEKRVINPGTDRGRRILMDILEELGERSERSREGILRGIESGGRIGGRRLG